MIFFRPYLIYMIPALKYQTRTTQNKFNTL